MSIPLTMRGRDTDRNGVTPVEGSTPGRISPNLHAVEKVSGEVDSVQKDHISDNDTNVGNGSEEEEEEVKKELEKEDEKEDVKADVGDEAEGEVVEKEAKKNQIEDVEVDVSGEPGGKEERDDDGCDEEDSEEDDSEEDDDEVEQNSVESLKEGVIKTKENKKELTVLLVGETGVGKTTMLSFIGNVLQGRSAGNYTNVHDVENEATGSEMGSKTDEPRLYQYTSKNDVLLRLLDTPGLADTRGLDHDKKHKENIAKAIRETITTVDAVLIIANGTVPRLNVATDYALSTLSSIFPRTLAKNIGFIFTNVPTRASLNFEQESLPEALRDAEQFLLDNPMGLQKNHKAALEKQRQQIQDQQDQLEREPVKKKKQSKALKELKDKHDKSEKQFQQQLTQTEEFALGTLVELFDWLNKCKAQPTKDILRLHSQAQAIDQGIGLALARMEDAAKEREQLQQLKADVEAGKIAVEKLKDLLIKHHIQGIQDYQTVLCYKPRCYSNCHERCTDVTRYFNGAFSCKTIGFGDCKVCGHPTRYHRRGRTTWKEVEAEEAEEMNRLAEAKYEARTKQDGREEEQFDLESKIDKLTRDIDDAMNRVANTAEEYAKLSLSGSFSGQIEKSIELLTLSIEAMQNNNPRREVVDEMRKIVQDLEQRLELLKEAARKVIAPDAPTLSDVGNFVKDTSKKLWGWVVSM